MTDFQALCAELLSAMNTLYKQSVTTPYSQTIEIDGIRHAIPTGKDILAQDAVYADLIDRARAALAQPAPQGPTDEEILALSQWHEVSYTLTNGSVIYPLQEGTDMKDAVLSFTRAVLQRWGAPASQSVAELTVQDCADMDKHRMSFIDEDSSGLITLDGCFTREELLELAQTRPATE
jgi:hypothetical protein